MLNKRGVSEVLTVVLIIILILVLLSAFFIFIRNTIKSGQEVASVQAELVTIDADIKDVNLSSADTVNITIQRGTGKILITNYTKTQYVADIAFLVDSTGSMDAEINDTKNTIKNFSEILGKSDINYSLALIEFKDYPVSPCGDSTDFANKTHTFSDGIFTTNVTEYSLEVGRMNASGGNDDPEAHLVAINSSLSLPWRQNSKRFDILISDSQPHANNCSITFYNPHSKYTKYTPTTMSACYSGPASITDMTNKLKNAGITFYYINIPGGLCDNDLLANLTTNTTGGKFYTYDKAGGVQNIILDLAAVIKEDFEEANKYDHMKVIFRNSSSSSCEERIYDPPLPLETKTYELSKCITNITRAEIYPVMSTASGKQVIGPALSIYEVRN